MWQKLGTSIGFLRLPGIVFSLGIIVLAYLLVNRIANRQAAIWTAGILAVSPLQFYHAQDLRMYSLATFFIIGWDLLSFELSSQETGARLPIWKWIILILFGVGALYSHALAGFGLLAPFAYFLLKKNWKHLGSLIGAGLAALILYLPWLVFVPDQISKVQHAFWTPRPGVVEILQSIIMSLGDIPAPPVVLGFVLFSCISIGILCGAEFFRNKQENQKLTLLVLMAIIPPACLFGLSFLLRPMFVPRAFLSAYVGLAACIGILASRARNEEKYLIGGFILLAAILTLPNQIMFSSFPRSPFQQASLYLLANTGGRVVVLHDNKLSFFPFEVYAPSLNNRFLADAPGSENDTLAEQTQKVMDISADTDLQQAIQGYEQVFFVVFQQTIDEYESTGGHPVMAKLTRQSGKPIEHIFGDLLILEYSTLDKSP